MTGIYSFTVYIDSKIETKDEEKKEIEIDTLSESKPKAIRIH